MSPDVVVATSSVELAGHVRRALDAYVRHDPNGDRRALAGAVILPLGDIRCHSVPFGDTAVAAADVDDDARLMSRTEVANLAGVSERTVSRWATTGRIERRGRRYTRSSVIAHLTETAIANTDGIFRP
jgi:hypothetical protein